MGNFTWKPSPAKLWLAIWLTVTLALKALLIPEDGEGIGEKLGSDLKRKLKYRGNALLDSRSQRIKRQIETKLIVRIICQSAGTRHHAQYGARTAGTRPECAKIHIASRNKKTSRIAMVGDGTIFRKTNRPQAAVILFNNVCLVFQQRLLERSFKIHFTLHIGVDAAASELFNRP